MTDYRESYSTLLATVELFLRGKASQAQLADLVKVGKERLAADKASLVMRPFTPEECVALDRWQTDAEQFEHNRYWAGIGAVIDADRARHMKALDESDESNPNERN